MACTMQKAHFRRGQSSRTDLRPAGLEQIVGVGLNEPERVESVSSRFRRADTQQGDHIFPLENS